jgi:hypothetical protein
MSQPKVSSARIFILLILSFAIVTGILEIESTRYAMGQRPTEPGVIQTTPPDSATEPGVIQTTPPDSATEPGVIQTTPPDSATETTLATTTTSTSTFSSTKGGFHISTTITNTTTVIPVQP